MFLKKLFTSIFFLFVIFIFFNCANIPSESNSPKESTELDYSKKPAPFFINYQSHQHQIKVTNNTFSHYRLEHHFPENSPSSIPDSTSNLILLDQSPLNKFQIDELQKTINSGSVSYTHLTLPTKA